MQKSNYKKAAMFGFCRALRKQTSGLFLASRHSADSQETRGSFKTTRAAMFGLDARIALAIFGALSVISGAALYSAIQNAKVTAIITEFRELGKAWEAYYLDTGEYISRYNNSTSSENYYTLSVRDLVIDPGVAGWKGPYLPYKNTGSSLAHPTLINLALVTLTTDVDWSAYTNGKCTSGRTCYLWSRIYISTGVDQEIAKAIDARIDNSDGASKGDFRWEARSYNLKYIPIKNPND